MESRLVTVNCFISDIIDYNAYDIYSIPLGFLYVVSMLRENGYKINFRDFLYDGRNNDGDFGQSSYKKEYIKDIEIQYTGDIPKIKRLYRWGTPINKIDKYLDTLKDSRVFIFNFTLTWLYLGQYELIELIKKKYPESIIIIGGLAVRINPEFYKKNKNIDHVLYKDSHNELIKLLSNIYHITTKSKLYNHIDEYPFPCWDLYKNLKYLNVLTSVGCTYRCKYCATSYLYNGLIKRDPLKVVYEITNLSKQYNIKNIVFYDDYLLYDYSQRLGYILKTIDLLGIKLFYHIPNSVHVRLITQEIANDFKRYNFRRIRISLETIKRSEDGSIDNKVTLKEFERTMKYLNNANLNRRHLSTYVLIGYPKQTFNEVITTINYCYKHKVRTILLQYSPIPNTSTFENLDDDTKYFLKNNIFHTHKKLMVYNLSKMSLKEYSICNSYNNILGDSIRLDIDINKLMGFTPV